MYPKLIAPSSEFEEPPSSRQYSLTLGIVGVTATVIALLIGLATGAPTVGFEEHSSDGVRISLCTIGLILAGCGISVRPKDWLSWIPLGVIGLLCYGAGGQEPHGQEWMILNPTRSWYSAMPNSWDSIQFLAGVIGIVSFIAAGWTRLPKYLVCTSIFALLAFYFSGVLTSVLSPPPTPLFVDGYWRRVTRFHSQFLYINNAYHFYSPEPGPPSEAWLCLKYEPENPTNTDAENPDTDQETEWITIPNRLRDTMDPLRLTYMRRLALVEQMAQVQQPFNQVFPEENQKSNLRRTSDAFRIPKPNVAENHQNVPPTDVVIRQVLPSYTNHFAKRFGKPGRKVASIKIYRVLHEVMGNEKYRTLEFPKFDPSAPGPLTWGKETVVPKTYRLDPKYPTLYFPYYFGEYEPGGKLLDSLNPELYWLVPIIDRKTFEFDGKPMAPGDFDRYFIDYVSIHAGSKRPKE